MAQPRQRFHLLLEGANVSHVALLRARLHRIGVEFLEGERRLHFAHRLAWTPVALRAAALPLRAQRHRGPLPRSGAAEIPPFGAAVVMGLRGVVREPHELLVLPHVIALDSDARAVEARAQDFAVRATSQPPWLTLAEVELRVVDGPMATERSRAHAVTAGRAWANLVVGDIKHATAQRDLARGMEGVVALAPAEKAAEEAAHHCSEMPAVVVAPAVVFGALRAAHAFAGLRVVARLRCFGAPALRHRSATAAAAVRTVATASLNVWNSTIQHARARAPPAHEHCREDADQCNDCGDGASDCANQHARGAAAIAGRQRGARRRVRVLHARVGR
mmetsp:Transcript_12022/g.50566  ORF Transcript_12022/g.50566 Transcript_12022/m.50566 type:complete len:333 (+) Transcript_12022:839-1837(+)